MTKRLVMLEDDDLDVIWKWYAAYVEMTDERLEEEDQALAEKLREVSLA